jgi:hypothetical protein
MEWVGVGVGVGWPVGVGVKVISRIDIQQSKIGKLKELNKCFLLSGQFVGNPEK